MHGSAHMVLLMFNTQTHLPGNVDALLTQPKKSPYHRLSRYAQRNNEVWMDRTNLAIMHQHHVHTHRVAAITFSIYLANRHLLFVHVVERHLVKV
jgi:hypothetical protein